MNIFYVSINAVEAARMLGDKHVIKMRLETAQLMTSCHIKHGSDAPYPSMVGLPASAMNHPCARWAQASQSHYLWLYEHFLALCKEKDYRWPGGANTIYSYRHLYVIHPEMPSASFIPPPQVMPDDCKIEGDSVNAYRKYYRTHKMRLCQYTQREPPTWLTESPSPPSSQTPAA